jgi:hypothetical protein
MPPLTTVPGVQVRVPLGPAEAVTVKDGAAIGTEQNVPEVLRPPPEPLQPQVYLAGVVTKDANVPLEQSAFEGGAADTGVVELADPQTPFTTAGIASNVAVTVQAAVTTPVVKGNPVVVAPLQPLIETVRKPLPPGVAVQTLVPPWVTCKRLHNTVPVPTTVVLTT